MLRCICILDGIIQMGAIALLTIGIIEIIKRFKQLDKTAMCRLALIICAILHILLVIAIDFTSLVPTHRYIVLDILCIIVCVIIEWAFTRIFYNNLTDLIDYAKGGSNGKMD